MLNPDSRVVLIDQLRPPSGYQLDQAIATTFTLQLGAALVPPLAFATHGVSDHADPLAVLEAVRSVAGRIDIYCQAGQIVVPKRASDLMAFLEPMLHPVKPPRNGFLFHPKIWFVHYTAEDLPDRYRLLCLTRNLVDSHAWDAAVALDGVGDGEDAEANRPLAEFLRLLPGIAVNPSRDRTKRAEALARQAMRVKWTRPDGVQDLRFHALGLPTGGRTVDYSGLRHLVISPFCDPEGLDLVTDGNSNCIVVSNQDALDAIEPGSLARYNRGNDSGSVFVLDSLASVPPEAPEPVEDASDSKESLDVSQTPTPGPVLGELAGLHAKMTVIEKNRRAHLIIGSANATSAAFAGNVEFLLEMWGPTKELGIKTMMERGPQKGPQTFRDLLQPYAASDPQPDADEEEVGRLRNLLRRLASVPLQLTVTRESASDYTLVLTSKEDLALPPDHELSAALLTRPGVAIALPADTAVGATFSGVPLEDITPFVVLGLRGPDGTAVDSVAHAPLLNDPKDRLDAVLARQVDTREKFLRFLALILGLADAPGAWGENAHDDSARSPWGLGGAAGYPGVFELIVNALADRPEAINQLDRLVGRLRKTQQGRELLPDGFEELWKNAKGALSKTGRLT